MATSLIGVAPGSGEGSANEKESRLTLKYLVQADVGDDAGDVCNTAGIPVAYSQYVKYPGVRVRDKNARYVDPNSNIWLCTVELATPEHNDGNTSAENDNPLLDYPLLALAYEEREEILYNTYATTRTPVTAIKSSAGEIFDPPPVVQRSSAVMTITQNYAYDWDIISAVTTYIDTINSDTFLGYPPHTLRITNIDPKGAVRNSTQYLEVTITMKFKPTWDVVLLDSGTKYYVGDGVYKKFIDDGVAEVGLLDGMGGKLPQDADPVFLPGKQAYTEVAFVTLGLPTTQSGYKLV
jgi:hypothetical protein